MLYKMSDKLVFDLAQEVEGSPNVFIRKDWLNILDNQNQNYNNNQSIIDTSQLSNSNKYMSYRESYFLIPMLMTIESTAGVGGDAQGWKPKSKPCDYGFGLKNWFGQIIHSFTLDYNGTTIIQQTPFVNMWNSFKLMTSLSYDDICTQGATIGFYPDDPTSWTWTPCPTVPNPVVANDSFILDTTVTPNILAGQGVANNSNALQSVVLKNVASQFGQFNSGAGNRGLAKRQSYIIFDTLTTGTTTTTYGTRYSDFLGATQCNEIWKSYIITKQDAVASTSTKGVLQINVVATVYLKHVHSFFNMCPLLKGVFMKMTMNLNNSTTSFSCGYGSSTGAAGGVATGFLACTGVSVPIGGINVGLIASAASTDIYDIADIASAANSTISAPAALANTFSMGSATGIDITTGTIVIDNPPAGGQGAFATGVVTAAPAATLSATATLDGTGIDGTSGSIVGGATVGISLSNATINLGAATAKGSVPNGGFNLLPATATLGDYSTFKFNISVGARCLDGSMTSTGAVGSTTSVYLYVPAYTFNPVFEQAYLSSPVKQIKYTDIYQYQVLNVAAGNQFNNLLTNGIANIKSVLILPYLCGSTNLKTDSSYIPAGVVSVSLSQNSGFLQGIPIWQSPFDPAGTGPTSPLSLFKNFNVQVSGQNAIYNMEKYAFEQFNNQLYGQNAVNGGLTDGLTSGLIDRLGFDMEYCYYYVNVDRMLPVEMSVPKSIQILGQLAGLKACDLYCFVEYGVEVSVDVLTGARV